MEYAIAGVLVTVLVIVVLRSRPDPSKAPMAAAVLPAAQSSPIVRLVAILIIVVVVAFALFYLMLAVGTKI